jgi:hypothetical protein
MWLSSFLFPQVSVIEAELSKLSAEQIVAIKENLNNLFAKCVITLGHEHHMRVAHSLQVTLPTYGCTPIILK